MPTDGYFIEASDSTLNLDMLEKYSHIQELYSEQQNIDKEIKELSKQIEEMPSMPSNLDYWISSFNNEFKMSDFKKLFEIKKKYETLIDQREKNSLKIKMFAIDGLLSQIKEVENLKKNN